MPHALVVIPARRGSKGIRRKNHRILGLGGPPLVIRAAQSALAQCRRVQKTVNGDFTFDLYIATDDPTIADMAVMHNLAVVGRNWVPDNQPVSEVIGEVLSAFSEQRGQEVSLPLIASEYGYDMVAICQPTSIDESESQIYEAMRDFVEDETLASLVTVQPEHRLLWDEEGPLYSARLNRQDRKVDYWVENGLLHVCRDWPRMEQHPQIGGYGSSMIGIPHRRFECGLDIIDIDTPADLIAARSQPLGQSVLICISADRTTGSGHMRRQLTIADELSLKFEVIFALHGDPEFATIIEQHGYPVIAFEEADDYDLWGIIVDMAELTPYDMHEFAAMGNLETPIITFENDIDPQAINALVDSGPYSGPRYFVARPEFQAIPWAGVNEDGRVLVTFGGTDPANMTPRAVGSLLDAGIRPDTITVVAPPQGQLQTVPDGVVVVQDPASMAQLMHGHSLMITSQGRTVYEGALVGIPTVSIAVNEREQEHIMLPGVVYLGHRHTFPHSVIGELAADLLLDLRSGGSSCLDMALTAKKSIDGHGVQRVCGLIEQRVRGLI